MRYSHERRLWLRTPYAEQLAEPIAVALATLRPPLRLPTLQTNIFWHRRYHQDQGNLWLRGLIADVFAE